MPELGTPMWSIALTKSIATARNGLRDIVWSTELAKPDKCSVKHAQKTLRPTRPLTRHPREALQSRRIILRQMIVQGAYNVNVLVCMVGPTRVRRSGGGGTNGDGNQVANGSTATALFTESRAVCRSTGNALLGRHGHHLL